MAVELPPDGTRVRAKAAGWNEEIPPERAFDLEPYDGPEDLEGPLRTVLARVPWGTGKLRVVLVNGREADPATVEAATVENYRPGLVLTKVTTKGGKTVHRWKEKG